MEIYENYQLASPGKRGLAVTINFMCFAVSVSALKAIGLQDGIVISGFQLLVVVLCHVTGFNPGNYALDIVVLDKNKNEVRTTLRILRNAPLIIFFLSVFIAAVVKRVLGFKDHMFLYLILRYTIGAAFLLIIANFITVYTNNDQKTILDERLGTRVYVYPKL